MKFKAFDVLRIIMALNFLTAAIYRIFNYGLATVEMQAIALPGFFALIVIGLEVVCGVLMLMNKWVKECIGVLIGFLIIAQIFGAIAYGPIQLLKDSVELFTYHLNPTDMYLHTTYLVMLVYMFFALKEKKN